MLKDQVTYKNFDNETVTKELHFHISKMKLVDNIHLKDEFEKIQNQIAGPERELTTDEIKMIVEMVKSLLRLAYGVRDGDEFIQDEETWLRFTRTAAYDEYMMKLFSDGGRGAMEFMLAVLPEDLRSDVAEAVEKGLPVEDAKVTFGDVKELPQKKFDDYKRDELLSMPDEDFVALVGTDPLKMSHEELQIAMQRKTAKDVEAS